MHFNLLASSALAVCALMPTALGVPTVSAEDGILARSQDLTVKWHPHTDCSSKGGPSRDYSRNVCLPLSETQWGVDVQNRYGECVMIAYSSGICDGEEKKFDNLGCWSLAGKWSVKRQNPLPLGIKIA